MAYAEGTTVDTGKSRIEIERLLQKNECSHVGVMHEPGCATVYFQRKGWQVQMRVAIPRPEDGPKGYKHRAGRYWNDADRKEWAEQKGKERWRQLLLVLKAKFTALEEGVETFEQGFFAYLVVGGQHMGDRLLPLVRQAQEKGTQLLLGAGEADARG
jgi:hypothetical protein